MHETEGLFAPATEDAHESLWEEELNKQLSKRVICFPSAARRRLLTMSDRLRQGGPCGVQSVQGWLFSTPEIRGLVLGSRIPAGWACGGGGRVSALAGATHLMGGLKMRWMEERAERGLANKKFLTTHNLMRTCFPLASCWQAAKGGGGEHVGRELPPPPPAQTLRQTSLRCRLG